MGDDRVGRRRCGFKGRSAMARMNHRGCANVGLILNLFSRRTLIAAKSLAFTSRRESGEFLAGIKAAAESAN